MEENKNDIMEVKDISIEQESVESLQSVDTEYDESKEESFDSSQFSNGIGYGIASMLGGIGGGAPDYTPLFKTCIETLDRFDKDNETAKSKIEEHELKIKALTVFLKLTGGLCILEFIILVIYIILNH